ncbi:hypothetical protein ACRQ5Q_15105 [Bradyrhizobium sp. PMVTL-01]|uniref:hypothetical protein n=1 Tax=Bradyrhizobium sp. PMVTL-01 TaxID=3434999 RepID=UPI003F72F8BD
MVRMIAPEGVASFSHAGHTFEVAEDGTLEVAEHAVDEAKAHGFTVAGDGEIVASEAITVKRESVLKVLEAMGVAANPAMRADKLAAAFEGAAARVKAPKTAETKAPAGDGKGADGKGGDGKGADAGQAGAK